MSEQKHYYTDEKNAQIVIALQKYYGSRNVAAEMGRKNLVQSAAIT